MTDITETLEQIDAMREKQETLRLDLYRCENLSDHAKDIIRLEISAMDIDVADLAEQAIRMIAKHCKPTIETGV